MEASIMSTPARPSPSRPEPLEFRSPTRGRLSQRRVEEFFDHQRTPSRLLPDPGPLVVNLTRCLIETLAGVRDLEQIARWVEPDAYETLQQTVAVTARSRRARGLVPNWPKYRLGRTRIDSPADGVMECVTVVHHRARAQAVAIRLVGIDGRWRADRIAVL